MKNTKKNSMVETISYFPPKIRVVGLSLQREILSGSKGSTINNAGSEDDIIFVTTIS